MRYKLVLENNEENTFPIDYPYMLSEIIEKNSEAYLADSKYSQDTIFSSYCYSPFLAKYKEIDGENNTIKLMSRRLYWIISSPIDEHVTSCARNIFVNKKIELCDKKLNVTGILKMNAPEITNEMKFICISPISVIKQIINKRKNYIYYEYDENISPIIKSTLERRYSEIYGEELKDAKLELTFDKDYIAKRNGRVTKLVNIVEEDGFVRKVKAIFAPFTVKGSPELIKIGYYCGFGDLTNYGFGVADIVEQSK